MRPAHRQNREGQRKLQYPRRSPPRYMFPAPLHTEASSSEVMSHRKPQDLKKNSPNASHEPERIPVLCQSRVTPRVSETQIRLLPCTPKNLRLVPVVASLHAYAFVAFPDRRAFVALST
jgi:hypothetical protein